MTAKARLRVMVSEIRVHQRRQVKNLRKFKVLYLYFSRW